MREDPARFGAWLLFFLGSLAAQKKALDANLGVERGILQLSAIQERIVAAVHERGVGRATSPQIEKELNLAGRTVRYHLDLLVRRGLLAAHGQKRGRYYTIASASGGRVEGSAEERLALLAGTQPPHVGVDPATAPVLHAVHDAGEALDARRAVASHRERFDLVACDACERRGPAHGVIEVLG